MSHADLFHVKLATGEERAFDLDQLDAAYKAGLIDESTLVLRAGSLRWVKLAELAGLDEPVEEPMPSSIAPMALDAAEVDLADLGPALATSEIPRELRPRRRGGKILGAAIALAVVAGIGFAATRARPELTSSIRSSVTTRLAKLTAKKADAPRAAAAVVAPRPQPAPVPPPPPATNVADPRAAQGGAQGDAPVPTMTASSLPDAKATKTTPKKRPSAGRK